uniref:Uncharacterized protein n=1 Tax=Rhizophora mucronata TaxID=61149 RepID=A0A2P2N8N6_RHIMU
MTEHMQSKWLNPSLPLSKLSIFFATYSKTSM